MHTDIDIEALIAQADAGDEAAREQLLDLLAETLREIAEG